MPADRRALRRSLAQQKRDCGGDIATAEPKLEEVVPQADVAPQVDKVSQADATLQAPPAKVRPKRAIGFDFDCTITVRHFYKVFAFGYVRGDMGAHSHCAAFCDWCRQNDIEVEEPPPHRQYEDLMCFALEAFSRHAGEDAFRGVFREVFLGGEERIALFAEWLKGMREEGVEFVILTAGTSTAVLRGLAAAPELLAYFPSDRVWDTQQSRHQVNGVGATKALMLRDLCPESTYSLLIDDAIERDRPPPWVLQASGVTIFDGLPYEGPGVNAEILQEIKEMILKS
mmetsp:Transcript_109312/g.308482  ORF Transcript_109312/g.308482 Transcript_109312/m.308482 type:complete len:285 (-) Transcript_109312:235-1089(-)